MLRPLDHGILTVTDQYRRAIERTSFDVVGVQDTGARGTDGATLRHVVVAGGRVVGATLDTDVFDAHPSFQFPEWVDASGNVFCRVPIAYWWRGNLPDAVDGTTPRWTMLLSATSQTKTINGTSCTFAANPGAFKLADAWLAQFYYGKFRGHDAGSSKIGSKAGQAHLGNVSFDNFRTYCANVGTNYHMGSLFEWHELLARMVVEKKTFQLFPEGIRQTQPACRWRGIEDMAFHGTVYAEWMDGIRTDASGNYEAWDQANGTYGATGQAAAIGAGESTNYNQGIVSGGIFDSLFIAATMGPNATSFIPDHSGRASDRVSRVCYAHFHAGYVTYGAFDSHFNYASSVVDPAVGARLAKW